MRAGASKFLFGTMDSNDLDTVDEKLNYMYDSNEQIMHDHQEQVTVLANMQQELVNHTRTINSVLGLLKKYHTAMHEALPKYFQQTKTAENQLQHLFKYLKLSSALAETKDAVSAAVSKINKFHQAIEDLAGGKVTSNLLYPHAFLKILQNVEKELPPPVKFYIPVNLENIHSFYSIVRVHSYTTAHTLRVVMQLPLRNNDQLFQLFEVINYPVYDDNLKRWAQWDLPREKLLISKDRMLYSLFKELTFDKECQIGELTVCPIAEVLLSVHSRPSCAVELFTKETTTHCKRKLISGLESPVLVKTPSHWLYSASQEHKLTLKCYETNGQEYVTELKLRGVGVLEGTDKCYIIMSGFKIPACIHSSSQAFGLLTELKFPSLNSIYSGDEETLMSTDWNSTLEVLDELDSELGTLGVKEYHLEGVFHRLKSHRDFKIRTQQTAAVTGLILIILLCAMFIYCYGFRCLNLVRCLRRQPRRRERRAASGTQALIEHEGLEMVARPAEIRVVLPPLQN